MRTSRLKVKQTKKRKVSSRSRLNPLHHITGPKSSWSDFAQLPLIVLITPQLLPIAPIWFAVTLRWHKVGRTVTISPLFQLESVWAMFSDVALSCKAAPFSVKYVFVYCQIQALLPGRLSYAETFVKWKWVTYKPSYKPQWHGHKSPVPFSIQNLICKNKITCKFRCLAILKKQGKQLAWLSPYVTK